MGRQVIRQPDGKYAVFSTGTDQWVMWDLTREQYIEHRAEHAAREAREDAARLLDDMDAGFYYAGYTFEEANAASVEHGGEDLSRKAAPNGVVLTAADPEPPAGTHVRDSTAERWVRSAEGDYWLRVGRVDGDPESWTKIAGNYGPVTVLVWGC